MQERSRDARRWLQVVVGGVLVAAVVACAAGFAAPAGGGAAGTGGAGGLASKLYAWTNANDKSRGFETSTIGGMDADDPAFGPRRARVPPVDRVIARLKGQYDPEYYDREHHGPVAQFINRPPASSDPRDAPANGGDSGLASGTAFVVDPDATDEAQFNINQLLRKSGRMSQDASELAELQREDAQITAEYKHAATRAASLLTLEGDMKSEMQQLSTKQVEIIEHLQNMTADETVASEGAESEAATSEDESAEGEAGGEAGGEEGGEEAEGGEVLGDTPDPDAPTAEDVAGGAEEQARGRTPMLAARRSTRAAPGSPEVRRGGAEGRPGVREGRPGVRGGERAHHDSPAKGPKLRIPPAQLAHVQARLRIPAAPQAPGTFGVYAKALTGAGRTRQSQSVAARAARAAQRAVQSAVKVGSVLDEARQDVEREAAAHRQAPQHVYAASKTRLQEGRGDKVREGKEQAKEQRALERKEMARALERQHALLRQEVRLRTQMHDNGVLHLPEARAHERPDLAPRHLVRHTGAP